MKRKPPVHNTRRVRAIDGNMRYTVVNKCLRTIQCESFQEYKLVLLLERDPSVKDYMSQPEQLAYHNDKGREVSYTPDFQVWYMDGAVALHEVTIQERRSKATQVQREQAAHSICEAHGWRYVVYTQETLPTGSELANLQLLFGFRASSVANPPIEKAVRRILPCTEKRLFSLLVEQLARETGLESPEILSAVFHLLWYGTLQTNWQQTLCQYAAPHPAAHIWREA